MKRLICIAALSAFAALAEEKAAAPAAAPAMPKPPEEMKVEQWFAGSWNCKGMQHAGPMGPEMKTSSRLDMKMEFGGFWLQVKGTAMAGPMKGKEMFEGMATWDGSAHQRYDFGPGGTHQLSSKGWDGDKLVFEGGGTMFGQKQTVKHTITKKGNDAWDSLFEIDGKPMIEESCTRAGAAAKK
jgi:hypothetical protein